MKPLILIGGGGHCLSVIDAALSAGMKIAGILDPAARLGDLIGGVPVVGDDHDIAPLAASGRYSFVVTLGSIKNPARRRALQEEVARVDGILATVVASTAYVSPMATLGVGTVVLHHATVNAEAAIGCGCIINTGAVVEHRAVVGDFTHVSTNATVNGDCHIASDSFIGSGAVVSSQTDITVPAVIGAGAVVLDTITLPGTYAGIPAKPVKASDR